MATRKNVDEIKPVQRNICKPSSFACVIAMPMLSLRVSRFHGPLIVKITSGVAVIVRAHPKGGLIFAVDSVKGHYFLIQLRFHC